MNTEANPAIMVPPAGSYKIDTGASRISFVTKHMFGLGTVRGRFPIRAGNVEVTDPAAASRVEVEVDVTGVDSGNPSRDKQVRSKALLDAEHFPIMVFHAGVAEGATLTGTLTVRDVTKPLNLRIEQITVQQDAFTARATTTVDRYEFGVTRQKGMTGRMLDLTVEVRCTR